MIVGEMHGSVETPAAFADLVCAAIANKRAVIVGLERPVEEQLDLEAFLHSEDHAAAKKALLSHHTWHVFDGRSSRAMLDLLESLRAWKVEAVAFDAAKPSDADAQREQRMAAALTAAGEKHPGTLLLVLTGNLHALRKAVPEFDHYPFMAMLLPREATLALFVADRGGKSYSQQNGRCGPHPMNSSGGLRRGIDLTRKPIGAYDGVLSTGLRSTASPPAIENAPGPPVCSEQ